MAPNQSEKYSRSISNAYYTLAASANRKRKRIPSKLIRVYTASKMSSGNSQLGPFSEGLFIYFFIIVYVVMSIFFGFSRPATKMLRLKEKGYQIEYSTVADIRERFIKRKFFLNQTCDQYASMAVFRTAQVDNDVEAAVQFHVAGI